MKRKKGKFLKLDRKLDREKQSCIPLLLFSVFLIIIVFDVCGTAFAFEFKDEHESRQAPVVTTSEASAEPSVCVLPTEEVLEEAMVFFVEDVRKDYDEYLPEFDLEPLSCELEAEEPAEEEALPTETAAAATEEASNNKENEVEYVLEATSDSRYTDVKLTQEDLDLLINIIWLEARGEPSNGRRAVAEVIFNRMVNKDYFPDTLYEVLYDREITVQFPTVYSLHMARPSKDQKALYLKEIDNALNGPYILPINVVFFKSEPENSNIWGTIGGHTFCYPWFWEPDLESQDN